MQRVISVIVMLTLLVPVFSGCDFKDLDRRVFIVAIGIDGVSENKEQIKVTFKAAMPTSGGETGGAGSSPEKDNSQLYPIIGDSLADIFRRIKSQTSMEPDYSHMKFICFSESFAERHEINHIVDFFVRRRDFQNIAWFSIAAPSAEALLSMTPKDERVPGNSLFMKFGEGTESPYVYKAKIYEIYSCLTTPGCSPTCSIMETEADKLVMNKTAFFYQDKLTLILGEEETKLLDLLSGKTHLGSFSIRLDSDSPPLGIGITKGGANIDVRKAKNGDINCKINVKIEGTLEEIDNFSGRSQNLEPNFNELVKKKVVALLDKLKENRVDPLKLQMKYWANDRSYELTNKWLDEIYPRVRFIVNSDVRIGNTGMLKAE